MTHHEHLKRLGPLMQTLGGIAARTGAPRTAPPELELSHGQDWGLYCNLRHCWHRGYDAVVQEHL